MLPRATGTDTELRVPRARKPEPEVLLECRKHSCSFLSHPSPRQLVAPDVAKAMAARPVPVSFAGAHASRVSVATTQR